jgi:hypothetical protein
MALRFAVQADDENECQAGLQQLLSLGLEIAMTPRLLTDNRWMARAKPPRTTKAPTGDDSGRGLGVSG